MTCPLTVPTPEKAPKRLIALSRSAPKRACWMLARICGIITAAANPWTVRAMRSSAVPGARPTARR